MGLASAMSTALTGLSASETQISVVGNNLANSGTVGFKASDATFATQFLQTLSVGAAPTASNGGTNPEQQGLGVMVAEIKPNLSQGTIANASSATDLAIQGDGFFIVQGASGQQLYTRNGVFSTNSQNQLVTSTGNRVMGYGVNNQFQIDSTQLQPIQIPLGTAMVAKATTSATLQGALTPTGTIANTAQVIESNVLTDGSKTYPQTGPVATLDANPGALSGVYKYYVAFVNGNVHSRPQLVTTESPLLNNNQVDLDLSGIVDNSGNWTGLDIYRSTNDQPGDTSFYKLNANPISLPVQAAQATYVDNATDASIRVNEKLSFTGPAASGNTALTNLVYFDGSSYLQVFPSLGKLQFTGSKGGNTLTTQTMQVTATSTLKDLGNFLQGSLGIQQSPGPDPTNPIPVDSGTGLPPGVIITANGQIEIVGNNGTDNAVGVPLSSLQLVTNDVPPQTQAVNLPFNTIQQGKGESVHADVIVYDSLGIPLSVRITAVLQSETSTATTYRWFADCGQNDPPGGQTISVGTGVISFDGKGNLVSTSNTTVSIGRANEPSVKPLQFNMDFSQVSGLASSTASLSVSRQDGSAPGVLSSFLISENGLISGVFSNGISQNLAQIRLARFSNPTGLEQQGQNLYAAGVNSGLPIMGNPGDAGSGTVVSGSLELSNTDTGGSLIQLITASTMYNANTRVISTAQQMFDSLLQLLR